MKYLGVDYGAKRIGIALSNNELGIAFPRKVIINKGFPGVLKELKNIIKKEEIKKIIVGLPIGLGGRDTEETKRVRGFVDKLRKDIKIPLEFENEMLTTRIAERDGIGKEHIDSASAALILQSYLIRNQNPK